jgi:hypothetical protein
LGCAIIRKEANGKSTLCKLTLNNAELPVPISLSAEIASYEHHHISSGGHALLLFCWGGDEQRDSFLKNLIPFGGNQLIAG